MVGCKVVLTVLLPTVRVRASNSVVVFYGLKKQPKVRQLLV